MASGDDNTVAAEYKRGLALARRGAYFEAHEAFEAAWPAARPPGRACVKGPVPPVAFACQDGRGRPVGAERQREKALRRLGPYAPAHRGLDVERLLAALVRAEPDLRQQLVEAVPQPPVAVE